MTRRASQPPGESPARPATRPTVRASLPSIEATAPAPPRGPRPRPMQTLRGIAVSPGVAIGPPLVVGSRGRHLPPREIAAHAVTAEQGRLERALREAQAEAQAAEAEARNRLGPLYADILGAHAAMIADPVLYREASDRIERQQISAEHAICEVLDGYAARLEGLADRHLAARAADVRDVQQRILNQFAPPETSPAPVEPLGAGVVLAHDLTPSQTAGLTPGEILGFATEAGGATSHTAIVAAALEIPAVVGLGPFLERARQARSVIIDGDAGLIILDPDAATLKRYRRAAAERTARFASLMSLADQPAVTLDGVAIRLLGNIEFLGEAATCCDRGAQGIGLYRTEFLYLNSRRPPTESEQVESYAAVVRSMSGQPVTIRTLDLGADKVAPDPDRRPLERNPFLGLRSLRLSLREPTLFRTQLRAILRVSPLGDVRVMFPLVSTLAEFRRARAIFDEVAAELTAEGVPIRADLPVGAMIEVPAAALMADQLAKEVDFFSIGTNDLIQYALAVDRTNETVAELYNAADPAVLRLIAMIVAAARRAEIEVNLCGTMGGDPLYAMLLVGLGLRQLSMPPHQVPEIKRVIRAVHLDQAEAIAAEALRLETAEEILALLRDRLRQVLPDTPAWDPQEPGG